MSDFLASWQLDLGRRRISLMSYAISTKTSEHTTTNALSCEAGTDP